MYYLEVVFINLFSKVFFFYSVKGTLCIQGDDYHELKLASQIQNLQPRAMAGGNLRYSRLECRKMAIYGMLSQNQLSVPE